MESQLIPDYVPDDVKNESARKIFFYFSFVN